MFLAPRIAELAQGDPQLRFIAAMCLYSRDVDQGQVPGPYSGSNAELYARSVLIPDEDFERHAAERDEELASRFGMPFEQVAVKRDVATDRAACGQGPSVGARRTA